MDKRITINQEICHGKPIITGTRVLVSNILSALASGQSIEEVLEDYPNLEREDILAALAFGSQLSKFDSLPYDNIAS